MRTINKKDLARELADKSGSTQKAALRTINILLEILTEGFREGCEVDLPGFGKFQVRERAARVTMNPATHEPMDIPASRTVKFTPKKALKEAVNDAQD